MAGRPLRRARIARNNSATTLPANWESQYKRYTGYARMPDPSMREELGRLMYQHYLAGTLNDDQKDMTLSAPEGDASAGYFRNKYYPAWDKTDHLAMVYALFDMISTMPRSDARAAFKYFMSYIEGSSGSGNNMYNALGRYTLYTRSMSS